MCYLPYLSTQIFPEFPDLRIIIVSPHCCLVFRLSKIMQRFSVFPSAVSSNLFVLGCSIIVVLGYSKFYRAFLLEIFLY